MTSALDECLPRDTVCTIDNAWFKLLLRGLEVGSRIHVLLGAYYKSASAKSFAV